MDKETRITGVINNEIAAKEEREKLTAELEFDVRNAITNLKNLQGGTIAYDFVVKTLSELGMPF